MTQETFDEEEKEERIEAARDKEVIEAMANLSQRYKTLFGKDPNEKLTPAEIQDKIAAEMTRRNLRPYKL